MIIEIGSNLLTAIVILAVMHMLICAVTLSIILAIANKVIPEPQQPISVMKDEQ